MAERQLLEEGAGQPAILLPSTPRSSILIPQLYLHTLRQRTLAHYHSITFCTTSYGTRNFCQVVIIYHCVIYARFATDPNPHPHTTTQEDSLVVHYSSRLVDNPGGIPEASPTVLLCLPSLAAYCTLRCWVPPDIDQLTGQLVGGEMKQQWCWSSMITKTEMVVMT